MKIKVQTHRANTVSWSKVFLAHFLYAMKGHVMLVYQCICVHVGYMCVDPCFCMCIIFVVADDS